MFPRPLARQLAFLQPPDPAVHGSPEGRAGVGSSGYGRLGRLVGLLVFGVVIFVLGDAAVLLAPEGSEVAAWWPAAGVSVAALTVFPRCRWTLALAIVAFSGLANVAGGRPPAVSAGFALANAAEAVVASWWLRRSSAGRPVLHTVADVWRLAVAALLGAITIGIGASLTVAGVLGGNAGATFENVVPSHLAAVLLIVPLALTTSSVARRRGVEVAGSWLLAGAVPLAVFAPGQTLPISFLALPPLLWAAMRLGVRSVALQLAMVGMTVTLLTGANAGPFAAGADGGWSPSSLVQMFVVGAALVMLPLAVAMSERERVLARAVASEQLFRRGFEDALVGMLLLRSDGAPLHVVEANAAAAAKLGVGHGEEVSGTICDDGFRTLGHIASGLASGQGWRGEMTDPHAPGGPRRFSVALSRLSGAASSDLVTCQVIDVTERHHAELELERQASHDHLTGLPNRAMFDQRLQSELERATDVGDMVAVLFLDLDDFKLINDGFGHRAGDTLLTELGRRISAIIRPGDMVARLGGDEFALICPRVRSVDGALDVAHRVRGVAERPFVFDDVDYTIGFSIGVTLSTADSTPARLLTEADLALYAAKALGKRAVEIYSPVLGERAATRVRLEAELEHAFERGEFHMYMQPVVALDTGRIEAAEALIRWSHPTRGIVAPAEWLDIAERSGLMVRLGPWILDESCRQAANWTSGPGGVAPAVHVNVSARQLEAPGFADVVSAALERHGLEPARLVIELTETNLAEIAADLVDELQQLADLGVRLAADDFGTGYSPLTRITELPVNMIKIDKQFVDGITNDPRSQAIARSLVELAATLGLGVVAEGIEHHDQAEVLRTMGCRSAQGFLWSRAVPGDELAALVEAQDAMAVASW